MGNSLVRARNQYAFNQLMKINHQNVDLFSLKGNKYPCRIVSVYDGDTCTALFKMNKNYVKFKIRMLGYDSPEMKPRLNVENREQIKREAEAAKQALITKMISCGWYAGGCICEF